MSGLILKNNIKQFWETYPDDVKRYVRQEVLNVIGHSSPLIRATVGTIITNTVCKEGLIQWSNLLETLLQMFDSQDNYTCEVMKNNISISIDIYTALVYRVRLVQFRKFVKILQTAWLVTTGMVPLIF